jgi:hypothetical protein
MNWLYFLISPYKEWEGIRLKRWYIIPILVGVVSAICNMIVSSNIEVLYLKAETFIRMSPNLTLPEAEAIVRLIISLSFLSLPLWAIIKVFIISKIMENGIKEIDYNKILLILSMSLLPILLSNLISTYLLLAKGFNGLVDLRDLDIILAPTIFSPLNREMLNNDLLFMLIREINIGNIWSIIILVSVFKAEGINSRRALGLFIVALGLIRIIEISYQMNSYKILWFIFIGGHR